MSITPTHRVDTYQTDKCPSMPSPSGSPVRIRYPYCITRNTSPHQYPLRNSFSQDSRAVSDEVQLFRMCPSPPFHVNKMGNGSATTQIWFFQKYPIHLPSRARLRTIKKSPTLAARLETCNTQQKMPTQSLCVASTAVYLFVPTSLLACPVCACTR